MTPTVLTMDDASWMLTVKICDEIVLINSSNSWGGSFRIMRPRNSGTYFDIWGSPISRPLNNSTASSLRCE